MISLVFLLNTNVFSNSIIKVENVFLDIKKDYKYHHELQTLYDKWIVQPEDDHKFHPDKLLKRDEFVGIAVETSCKKCISPNSAQEFVNKYKTKPFFDVWINSKYFYCISYAEDNNFVLGYDLWVKCNDSTQKDSQSPFCNNNNIKLEEALAVIMRMWWIMTAKQADEIVSWIKNWQKYPNLALDLEPVYTDGTVNSFYPYFKKALEYEVIDYDAFWNKKIYKLVEKKGKYLRPSTLITKQDFLKMAFVALKANSCFEINDDKLAIKMKIFDKQCNENKALKWQCSLSKLLKDDNILDFDVEVWWACEKWIDEKTWYVRRFVNKDSWEQQVKYGKFIDDYNFLNPWNYRVFLRVTDRCWNSAEVYNDLFFDNDLDSISDLKVSIDADPIIWPWPLEVDFSWIVNGGKWPYEYNWDFWDSQTGDWKIIKHIFPKEWVYEVILTVIDSSWNSASASVFIKVLDNVCSNDSDNDSINDCLDMCPLVKWDKQNNWCPILIKKKVFYETPKCLVKKQSSWFIFWNVFCSSCPCDNSVDFRTTLRECDTIIPAITSPSEKDIYSRWKLFPIVK